MSLRDTIDAARREAQEAGGIFSSGQTKAEEADSEEQNAGFSKRSTARAKPATAAASSVRVISANDAKEGRSGKKASEMSKEERKAERAKTRAKEDRLVTAANILLKQDKDYARTQKVWWILLGVGLALTVVSFGINSMLNREGADVSNAGVLVPVALVSLVLAYVCIIGAFVYDLIKARPIRKRVDEQVKGMTRKRLDQLIAADAEQQAQKKANK